MRGWRDEPSASGDDDGPCFFIVEMAFAAWIRNERYPTLLLLKLLFY